jgi:pimeloyl-ACP methyl ester carboxylesterase
MTDPIHSFRVHVPDADLEDLRVRLFRTRMIPRPPEGEWKSGVPVDYLATLLDYWRSDFEWQAAEARINRLAHVRVDVDGRAVHAALQPARGNAIPIALVHGWPSSFIEMLDLADHLADPGGHGADPADAFDVVIPSLPGYGFSDPPSPPTWNPHDVGLTIGRVMAALGYVTYGIHAYDVGASAMTRLMLARPEVVIGYHTTEPGIPGPFPRPDPVDMSDEERQQQQLAAAWNADEGGYFALLGTRPQTLAHALNDSPAGLAAWIVEKWWSWTVPPASEARLHDSLSMDQILSNISLYWFTQTIGSANWTYYGTGGRARTIGEHMDKPVGVALTTQPIERASRSWASRFFSDIRTWVELGEGGHFVTMERPGLLATAIRDFFRPLRELPP